MFKRKSTGRKPGHNASSKGFTVSPPEIPAPPTVPLHKVVNASSVKYRVSNSPPPPPTYDDFGSRILTTQAHESTYGSCLPKERLFGNGRAGRVHSCKCGKQWIVKDMSSAPHQVKGAREWREIKPIRDRDSSLAIPAEEHVKLYGTFCLSQNAMGGKVGKTYTCACGQQWILKDMSNVRYQSKGSIEWVRVEY